MICFKLHLTGMASQYPAWEHLQEFRKSRLSICLVRPGFKKNCFGPFGGSKDTSKTEAFLPPLDLMKPISKSYKNVVIRIFDSE